MALIPLFRSKLLPVAFVHGGNQGSHWTEATHIGDLHLVAAKVPGYGERDYATGATRLFVPCAHPGCMEEASELEKPSRYQVLKEAYLEYLWVMKSKGILPPEYWTPFKMVCNRGHIVVAKSPFDVIYKGGTKLSTDTKYNLYYPCHKCTAHLPIPLENSGDVINSLRARGLIEQ